MGRKRHNVVDTGGLLLAVVARPPDVPDRDGARLVLRELAGRCSRLRLIRVEGGSALSGWAQERLGFRLGIVLGRAEQRDFELLPRQWMAERTFG